MKYLYYPGCSLEGTAREYDLSTRAFMQELGADLLEIKDWTCCGASAAEATSYLLSLALPACILAMAEKMNGVGEILVPCSACYLNLKKVEEKSRKDPEILDKINTILEEEKLQFRGQVRVRHHADALEVAARLGESRVADDLSIDDAGRRRRRELPAIVRVSRVAPGEDEGVALVDHAGGTPLHRAGYVGDASITRLLVRSGANPWAKDDKGRTPLDAATKTTNLPAYMALLEEGTRRGVLVQP